MPYPRLIAPIPGVIERLNRAQFIHDAEARQATLGVRAGTTVNFDAQVRIIRDPARDVERGGVRLTSRGYFVKRTDDGVTTLAEGDRVVSRGNRPSNAYLMDCEPICHWDDIGGAGAHKWWFGDREPVDG